LAEIGKILWLSEVTAPPMVQSAIANRWELTAVNTDKPLEPQLNAARLAMIYSNGHSNETRRLGRMLEALDHSDAVAVLILPDDADAAWKMVAQQNGPLLTMRTSESPATLSAHLEAAAALQPLIQSLHVQLAVAQKMATTSAKAVEHLDEEMRLAARLQRDFLPRRMPDVGPVRFGVLYRPASWLSGDIYDIARLDEKHVGFYVADAVGHGMPAALLTMFIKHALQTKRIVGNTYQIVPPEISLAELNQDICQQNLSSCQFCTAVYGVLDIEKLTLTYSRAGHPPPILMHADGRIESLIAPGSLLGIFPDEQYESRVVSLRPGDRLVIYTDGAEEALRHAANKPGEDLVNIIAPLAGTPREEMLLQLTAWIDAGKNNPNGEDDITIMVVDVER